jgi:hypothetical protein
MWMSAIQGLEIPVGRNKMTDNNSYKNKKNYFLVCIYVLNITSILTLYSSGSSLCTGNHATLDCLTKNFTVLYATNSSLFWDILHDAEKRAQNCESSLDMADFLNLVHLDKNNIDFHDYFSDAIEHLCISNSQCLFDGLLLVPGESQIKIIDLLRDPTFVDYQEIREVFFKYRHKDTYKRIMNLYFGRQRWIETE